MSRRRLVVVAFAVLGILGVGGCGEVHSLAFPVPAPTTVPAASTTTALADPAAVGETGVEGVTSTTAVALGPGSTTILGTVTGVTGAPSASVGPVAGATVQIERFVGDQTASMLVQSSLDGAFQLSGILGGRYLVRAWKVPDLAMTTPQIFYVDDGATKRLQLHPGSFRGPTVTSSFAPDPAVSGQPTTVLIEVTTATVSATGIVQYQPAVDRIVQLAGATGWKVRGDGRGTTDAAGEVSFVAACRAVGATDPLSAIVERRVRVALVAPPCATAPSAPTTVAPTTVPPATVPPVTVPPSTVPPTTVPPTTAPPTTAPPTTLPPVVTTAPPINGPPSTLPPTTLPPTTLPPTTLPPTTPPPGTRPRA
jgi:hypothetical protein